MSRRTTSGRTLRDGCVFAWWRNNQEFLGESVDTVNKQLEFIQEEKDIKEAAAQATILEMIGDLKNADEKPPDNVLFVCKLNAVTTDEDLEIIFRYVCEYCNCAFARLLYKRY